MIRRTLFAAAFALALAAPLAPAPSAADIPAPPPGSITERLVHWRVLPERPCPDDSVYLAVEWCQQCVHLVEAERSGPLSARIRYSQPDSMGCASSLCAPMQLYLPFGHVPPGPHAIEIELVELPRDSSGGNTPVVRHATAPFFVRDSCGTGNTGALPFVDRILIAGATSPLPCPDDSIRVALFGHFPDNCHFLRSVEWFQPVCIVWPCLPIVQVLVDDGGCLGRPCIQIVTPWEAKLTLPPLPTGAYSLLTELAVVTCSDSFPPGGFYSAATPFRVASAEECGSGPRDCVAFSWPHGGNCDAELDTSGHAVLVLREASRVPLAGLQGHLRLSTDALRIERMESAAAAGMVLTWTPTPDGADWVLFSSGAPLPSVVPPAMPNDILRVRVGARPGQVPPPTSTIAINDGFGADSVGTKVPLCPELAAVFPPANVARICLRRPCDANGDGRSDVRDLVLMVRCLHYACPDSSHFDCDGNGDFAIDDVLCCARRILHRDTHDTTGSRPAPEVHVALEAPRETPSGWVLPLRLTGAAALGGARIEIAYPSDRFTVTGLTQGPGADSWLSLWDTDAGALVLGMLNLADPRALDLVATDEVSVELQLALRPGAQPGGSVALTAGEFSALDGTPLAAPIEPGSIPVVTPAKLALSSGSPNPFSSETRFSLDLDRASQVEVTVHDLSGRRVATILHGSLPAGRHSMSWNGTSDRGGRAAQGLYFVRCVADGRVVSQKVAILRQ